jgi:hypothetical protein
LKALIRIEGLQNEDIEKIHFFLRKKGTIYGRYTSAISVFNSFKIPLFFHSVFRPQFFWQQKFAVVASA